MDLFERLLRGRLTSGGVFSKLTQGLLEPRVRPQPLLSKLLVGPQPILSPFLVGSPSLLIGASSLPVGPSSLPVGPLAIGSHLQAQVAQLFQNQLDAWIEIPIVVPPTCHRHNVALDEGNFKCVATDTVTSGVTSRRTVGFGEARWAVSGIPRETRR